MTATGPKFAASPRTRLLYALTNLGIPIPTQAVGGVITFHIVDAKWFFAGNDPVMVYPLHGKYLKEIEDILRLNMKTETSND